MRIALIGSAPASVALAPYRDAAFTTFAGARPQLEPHQFPFAGQEWQIWGCSPGAYGQVERADRWFELHRWEPGKPWFSPEYVQWLKNFKGPVYTTEVIPEMPSSVRLPRERIAQEFGLFFLGSSLSFMMAMAILEIQDWRAKREPTTDPVDEIGLWGVDMAANEEWGYQRAGCQFFIQEAQRRGINVVLPPESDLGQPSPMYGISEWSNAHIKGTARMRELNGRLADANNRAAAAQQEVMFLRGALDNLDYMLKTWVLHEHSPLTAPDAHGRQLRYFNAQDFGPRVDMLASVTPTPTGPT